MSRSSNGNLPTFVESKEYEHQYYIAGMLWAPEAISILFVE
jgi:hypothetical protein